MTAFLLLVLGLPFPAAGQEPSTSAAFAREAMSMPSSGTLNVSTVPVGEENPLNLDFLYDQRGAQVQVNYRLRWDFRDIPRVPGAVGGFLRSPVHSVVGTTRDLTHSAHLRFYGLRIKPSKLIVWEEVRRESAASSGRGAAAPGDDVVERRSRLSLMPLFDDIRQNLPGDIRRQALTGAFDAAVPQARSLGYGDKKRVLEQIMNVEDDWGLPIADIPLKYLLNVKTSTSSTPSPR